MMTFLGARREEVLYIRPAWYYFLRYAGADGNHRESIRSISAPYTIATRACAVPGLCGVNSKMPEDICKVYI